MNIFEIDDIRRYIFSFLRKKPQLTCSDCNCVLIWDKKVKKYIIVNISPSYFFIKNGNYCNECHSKYFNFNCTSC